MLVVIARCGIDDRMQMLGIRVASDGLLTIYHVEGINKLLRGAESCGRLAIGDGQTVEQGDAGLHLSAYGVDGLLVLSTLVVPVLCEIRVVGSEVVGGNGSPQRVVVRQQFSECLGHHLHSIGPCERAVLEERTLGVCHGLYLYVVGHATCHDTGLVVADKP